MNVNVKVHHDTFGVTQAALKALRDELADRLDHDTMLWELPSVDGQHVAAYGLAIVDGTTHEVVIIGDGFRGDGGGVGGAGHITARALLSIYGIHPLPWDSVRFDDRSTDWEALARKLAEASGGLTPARGRRPHYVRHVLRR